MPINLVNMTNLEKCNAGIEYSYADKELIALKTEAIRQCKGHKDIRERFMNLENQFKSINYETTH